MHGLQQLFSSDLPIPLWQLISYVGLVSYFMVQRWFKLSFLTSFILVLYWLHYAFRSDLVAITNEAHLARAIYYVLGFALILLSIFALTFLEVDADSLLEKREKEIALLKAQARNAEKATSALQAQLDKEEGSGSDSQGKKREKKLNAKIEKLEKRLQEAERLLEARDSEITGLQTDATEAQKNASAFEALLEMYRTQESNTKKKLEEELNAKIEELRDQLQERDGLLKKRNTEVAELQVRASDAETNVAAMEAQLEKDTTSESAAIKTLQRELNHKVANLEDKLKQGETLLENRNAEISALRATAAEAQKAAAATKAQLEKKQSELSAANEKTVEEFSDRLVNLENQVKQNESLLEQSNREIAEFRAKASEADKRAAALKAQLEKDQSQGSVSKKKLEERLNAKIAKLENQLKQGEGLLEKRNAEITELQAKASEAQKNASTVKAQSEKDKAEVSAAKKKLEDEHNARIAELRDRLQERERLLEKRHAEIAELQARASDAETNVAALRAQLDEDTTKESAAIRKLERELNHKVTMLEDKLKQGETLLENRNSEITALKAKASEAEKNASALKAQLDNDKVEVSAAHKKLEEELNANVSKLNDRLKQSESLVEARNTEVAELKAKAAQAEGNASALKAQLEKEQTQVSAANRKLEDELNTKIAKLEAQLKQGETLLKTRNSEIATLQAKASAAEKSASALKAKLEKETTQVSPANKMLEAELNGKIAKLEKQVKEGESLLEQRNAEIADFKAMAAEAVKGTSAAKPHATVNRQAAQTHNPDDKSNVEEDVRRKLHQFQYAVKYLEDEIKEKDRLLSLMAKKTSHAQGSTKSAVDEDLKKKIHQLEQAVKYLENQGKEKDGLLGLMAKRNRELADLKSKAEERLEVLEANIDRDQTGKGSQTDIATER